MLEHNLSSEAALAKFRNFLKTKKEGYTDLASFKLVELQKYAKEFPEFENDRKARSYGDDKVNRSMIEEQESKQIKENDEAEDNAEDEMADAVGPLPGDRRRGTSDHHKKVESV